jgi:hypothetical protein
MSHSNHYPPPPNPDEIEAAMRHRMTTEEERQGIEERERWIAEYNRIHPDGWKPEHLKK